MKRYHYDSQAYYDHLHQLAQMAQKPSPERVAECRRAEEAPAAPPPSDLPPPARTERRPLAA